MKIILTIFVLIIFNNVQSQNADLTKITVKEFITLLYPEKEDPFNILVIEKEAPEYWIKQDDLPYLMSLLKTKEPSKCVMHIYSSHLRTSESTIAGHAADLINCYRENDIYGNFLNRCANVNDEDIMEIEQWWSLLQKKN